MHSLGVHQTLSAGYKHPGYAESLSEFGSPRPLPRSGGWVLERSIAGTAYVDAMGCYPVFCCEDWSKLSEDLDELRDGIVSLVLVTDPFGEYDASYLRTCFADIVVPFKNHFAVDLSRPLDTFVSAHHRRNAGKALRNLEVELCASPADYLAEWKSLYGELAQKHRIKGIAAFSNTSFAKQFAVPGLVAFRAAKGSTTEGMVLWYLQEDRAYYHLGAYSRRGYELMASFALFSSSIQYFAQHGCRWLNLGAGAGTDGEGTAGLSRFKEGWSNCTRTAFLCGRVYDRKRYDEIVGLKHVPTTAYFPAYRLGEFQ